MPWKKVLYEDQGVPDNYVDSSFLSNLNKDLNVIHYTLWEAIIASCRITHELSCVALFIVAFNYLQQDEEQEIDANNSGTVVIAIIAALMAVIMLAFVGLIGPARTSWVRARDIAVFLLFGYGFSPLLKNLTETISTDTIYAMVSGMILVHLYFQDYGASSSPISGQLSLNAVLFAAVCLASRLPSTLPAFILLTLAAELFAAAPVYHRWVLTLRPSLQAISTVLVAISAVTLTATVSVTFAILLIISFGILNLLCPTLFVSWQKHKENIHGPWDEAVPMTEIKK